MCICIYIFELRPDNNKNWKKHQNELLIRFLAIDV